MSKTLIAAGIASGVFVALFFLYGDPYTAITSPFKPSPVKQVIPGFLPNNSSNIEIMIHQMINEHRETKGLQTLEWDENLAIIARNHSKDMANRGYFEHEDPEGHNHVYRYEILGYRCDYASGENIFMTEKPVIGDSDEKIADTAVVGWMNSEGHRENILYDGFHKEGIGVYLGLTDAHITQNFC